MSQGKILLSSLNLKENVSKDEYVNYGELFEKDEDIHIGENGFKQYLEVVEYMEYLLGIDNIATITNETIQKL